MILKRPRNHITIVFVLIMVFDSFVEDAKVEGLRPEAEALDKAMAISDKLQEKFQQRV